MGAAGGTKMPLLLFALGLGGWAAAVHEAGEPSFKLADNPNMVANTGVWKSEFYIRNDKGELINRYSAQKIMQIHSNLWYQINKYDYQDGRHEEVRFIGKPTPDGGIDYVSPDRDYFKDIQRVYRSQGPHLAIWSQVDRKTGREMGVEFVSTFGINRIASGHVYKWNADFTECLGVDRASTVHEIRVSEPPKEPLFILTAEERKRLGLE